MNMRLFLKSIIIFTVLSRAETLEASHKDNGGSLTAMQKARALSRDELTIYLSTNSALTRRILEGLVLYVSPDAILDPGVKATVLKMRGEDPSRLFDDVRYSNYNLDPQAFRSACGDSGSKDMCTENSKPGATIYFNVDQLVQRHVSLAELIGLIMHEHSRHFACQMDNEHHLANFYMEKFLRNEQVGKIFTLTDGLRFKTGNEGSERYYLYATRVDASSSLKKVQASSFCVQQGFREADSFELLSYRPPEISGSWNFYFTASRQTNADSSSTIYFAKIVCIGTRLDQ